MEEKYCRNCINFDVETERCSRIKIGRPLNGLACNHYTPRDGATNG